MIHFAELLLKSSFNFLGPITKCQECIKSEALYKIWEVLHYAKDGMEHLKTDRQSNKQFGQINLY